MPGLIEIHLAVHYERFAQSLSGSLESGFHGGKAQSVHISERLLLDPLKIALLNDFAILGTHFTKIFRQTRIEFVNRVPLFWYRCGEGVRKRFLGFEPAALINQGVARDLEKPGPGIFNRAKGFTLSHRL